ncbi:MAG: hypothetical protein QM831_33440 [Kofleriaceae bacterium]
MRALLITMVTTLWAATAMARGHVVVTDTKVEILDDVHWIGTTTTPMVSAQRTFDAVASTLQGNPSIHLEVVGFGSDLVRGNALMQAGLGKQRADVIVKELVRRGVDPTRLTASGEAKPHNGRLDPVPIFVIVTR